MSRIFRLSRTVGLLTVFALVALFLLPLAAQAQQPGVPVSLRPAQSEAAVGQVVTISITVSADQTNTVSGAQTYLNYSRTRLQVVDAQGNPATSVTPGNVFFPAGPWRDVLENTVTVDPADSTRGFVNFAGGKGTAGSDANSEFTLALVNFKVLQPLPGTGTAITFNTAFPRITRLTRGFTVVTGTLTGATILPPSALTFVVNSTADPGDGVCNQAQCTLREAIAAANANVGAVDNVNFDLTGTTPFVIRPTSALPTITDPAKINGYSQPGSAPATNPPATILIELDGSLTGAGANGLVITAGGSRVRGLAINRFPGHGILVQTNGGNQIDGNHLGTDVTGALDRGNGVSGVRIEAGAANNVIGGPGAADRNVISGNLRGVVILSADNLVQGNFIGTGALGAAALGNDEVGVRIEGVGAPRNSVLGNVVSGQVAGIGVLVQGASNTTVGSNKIGTNTAGTAALGNLVGARVAGGSDNSIAGNVISGNGANGVEIDGVGGSTIRNVVANNNIGTNGSGAAALGNRRGVNVEGGAAGTTISGNLISGNTQQGVRIAGVGTTPTELLLNFIGTDASGTNAVANGLEGLLLLDVSNTAIGRAGSRNVISGNGAQGVFIDGGATNTVRGNYIGTNTAGTGVLGNVGEGVVITRSTGNVVGGLGTGEGNVISGNLSGIAIQGALASGNRVEGNKIGVNASGAAALGNRRNGVVILSAPNNTVGGTTSGAGNTISANGFGAANGSGVVIDGSGATGNLVKGNFIGTNAPGTTGAPLGNFDDGVFIVNAANNIIGGPEPGAGNAVAHNRRYGVLIANGTATGNAVQGNVVHMNGSHGVAILTGASGNVIGGTGPGAGNAIHHSGGDGVSISLGPGINNSILGNSIFGNAQLGIDLGDDGTTTNDALDADTGPNNLQNFPVLTLVRPGASTDITGRLNSRPNTQFRLEFFHAPVRDPSGFGEGDAFLGFILVTTDASGTATFAVSVAGSVPLGQFVTATATDPNGNTSEFSEASEVLNAPPEVQATPSRTVLYTHRLWDLRLAVFQDPDVGQTHTATIDWGDGSDPSAGAIDVETGRVSGSHIYLAPGEYTVTVTVTDSEGGEGQTQFDVIVRLHPRLRR